MQRNNESPNQPKPPSSSRKSRQGPIQIRVGPGDEFPTCYSTASWDPTSDSDQKRACLAASDFLETTNMRLDDLELGQHEKVEVCTHSSSTKSKRQGFVQVRAALAFSNGCKTKFRQLHYHHTGNVTGHSISGKIVFMFATFLTQRHEGRAQAVCERTIRVQQVVS